MRGLSLRQLLDVVMACGQSRLGELTSWGLKIWVVLLLWSLAVPIPAAKVLDMALVLVSLPKDIAKVLLLSGF